MTGAEARHEGAWAKLQFSPDDASGGMEAQAAPAHSPYQQALGYLHYSELHAGLLGESAALGLRSRSAQIVILATSMHHLIRGANNTLSQARRCFRSESIDRAQEWAQEWLDRAHGEALAG